RVILQILLEQYVVDKAGEAVPVVLGLRIRQGHVPLEVVVLRRETVVVLDVEHFLQRASAVPERNLALAVEALELVEQVRTHWRHAGATADKDHLRVGILGEEFTE